MLDGACATWNVVRIVAGEACHLAALKTGGFAQAVCGSGDLEFVIPGAARSVVEINEIIAEIHPRREGIGEMLVAPNLKRQRTARRLEVALHASFELMNSVQFCRIYDR